MEARSCRGMRNCGIKNLAVHLTHSQVFYIAAIPHPEAESYPQFRFACSQLATVGAVRLTPLTVRCLTSDF